MTALFQLIAHEYRKYVFTRGFLLFLLIIPASALFGFFAAQINERAAPVRAFTVIDETGRFGTLIDEALAVDGAREAVEIWDAYAGFVLAQAGPDAALPYPFSPDDPNTIERQADFTAAGGIEGAMEAADDYLPEGTPPPPMTVRDRFVRVPVPGAAQGLEPAEAVAALGPLLKGDETLPGTDRGLFAVVVIPADIETGGTVQFWTNNLIDSDLQRFLDRTLTQALRTDAYLELGVDTGQVRAIESITVPVKAFKVDAGGDEAGLTEFAETYIPLGLAYALLFLITSVGGMLLTSTVEEKSNKIVEVLLSSVSATQLMVGKLVGLALVGMTLPTIFLTAGYAALVLLGGGEVAAAIHAALFASPLVPLFFFYFLVGYLLFASIYLAVGAMSNSIQDAQSFVGPLTILLLLPIPFLQMIVQDPNGTMARIFTWIPIYTPYVVMMRIAADPPVWELVGATALLLVVVIYVVTTMGRVYRNGVLSSGGAPSLRQVRELARR
jgi:ABC-2 type transport system permease protein